MKGKNQSDYQMKDNQQAKQVGKVAASLTQQQEETIGGEADLPQSFWVREEVNWGERRERDQNSSTN